MYKLELHAQPDANPEEAVPHVPDPKVRAVLVLDPTSQDMASMAEAILLHVIGTHRLAPEQTNVFTVYNFQGVKEFEVKEKEEEAAAETTEAEPEKKDDELEKKPEKKDDELEKKPKKKGVKTEFRPVYGNLPTSFSQHLHEQLSDTHMHKLTAKLGFDIGHTVKPTSLTLVIRPAEGKGK